MEDDCDDRPDMDLSLELSDDENSESALPTTLPGAGRLNNSHGVARLNNSDGATNRNSAKNANGTQPRMRMDLRAREALHNSALAPDVL